MSSKAGPPWGLGGPDSSWFPGPSHGRTGSLGALTPVLLCPWLAADGPSAPSAVRGEAGAFAVASALVNCTNSYDYEEPDPQDGGAGQYAKQHVPEQHPCCEGTPAVGPVDRRILSRCLLFKQVSFF